MYSHTKLDVLFEDDDIVEKGCDVKTILIYLDQTMTKIKAQ